MHTSDLWPTRDYFTFCLIHAFHSIKHLSLLIYNIQALKAARYVGIFEQIMN